MAPPDKKKHFQARKSIWFKQDLWERLEKIALKQDRTESYLVRLAVSEWIRNRD